MKPEDKVLSIEVWEPRLYEHSDERMPPRYHIQPLLGIEFHIMYDGSGQRDKYPDGIIYALEEAKADAEYMVKSWNNHKALIVALERMVKMHDLMMKKVNHKASFYDAECITEMNEAPQQARILIDQLKEK